MSTARSVFTESIEDHLALKKQNLHLEASMPLARYDVGDPLDRYPGGRGHADEGTVLVADSSVDAGVAVPTAGSQFDVDATALFTGPSPEQAMEAATQLDPAAFGGAPFEPLTGMAPMLSLVEDIEEDDDAAGTTGEHAVVVEAEPAAADVLRFPGGVGPRIDATDVDVDATGAFEAVAAEQTSFDVPAASAPVQTTGFDVADATDAATGEQPVLVIDTEEPFGSFETTPATPPSRGSRTKPRFFGLGRKKGAKKENADGWFTDGPRDFNWD